MIRPTLHTNPKTLSFMHRQNISRALVIVTIALASFSLVQAQVKSGKTRALKTAQWMKCVMKPQCEALKKGLESEPATNEAWQSLAASAALLNEGSFLLMDDGRCPDGVWAEAASKTLRNGSAEVLKALEAKDLTAAKTAFGNMTKSCSACHDKHKEKK